MIDTSYWNQFFTKPDGLVRQVEDFLAGGSGEFDPEVADALREADEAIAQADVLIVEAAWFESQWGTCERWNVAYGEPPI